MRVAVSLNNEVISEGFLYVCTFVVLAKDQSKGGDSNRRLINKVIAGEFQAKQVELIFQHRVRLQSSIEGVVLQPIKHPCKFISVKQL